MAYSRLPMKDPRTVSREIPGLFDVIFPQLTPGVVSSFNAQATSFSNLDALPNGLVQSSSLQQSMLFEVAFARGEQILNGIPEANWDDCLNIAIRRQRHHFDAQLPDKLLSADTKASEWVASNLVAILHSLQTEAPNYELIHSPEIAGYQWIASGNGDFSIGSTLIEVKCTSRNFRSADYRQVLMYWLLSYASSIEHDTNEWTNITLVNPRRNCVVALSYDELIEITAAGKSKVEILELFSSMVGDLALKSLPEFRF